MPASRSFDANCRKAWPLRYWPLAAQLTKGIKTTAWPRSTSLLGMVLSTCDTQLPFPLGRADLDGRSIQTHRLEHVYRRRKAILGVEPSLNRVQRLRKQRAQAVTRSLPQLASPHVQRRTKLVVTVQSLAHRLAGNTYLSRYVRHVASDREQIDSRLLLRGKRRLRSVGIRRLSSPRLLSFHPFHLLTSSHAHPVHSQGSHTARE